MIALGKRGSGGVNQGKGKGDMDEKLRKQSGMEVCDENNATNSNQSI
jgi:hypothetical protein